MTSHTWIIEEFRIKPAVYFPILSNTRKRFNVGQVLQNTFDPQSMSELSTITMLLYFINLIFQMLFT